jgi:hypothetical protein
MLRGGAGNGIQATRDATIDMAVSRTHRYAIDPADLHELIARGAGHGDHWGAGLGEGGGDPVAKAAAGADDDGGPAGKVAHGVL